MIAVFLKFCERWVAEVSALEFLLKLCNRKTNGLGVCYMIRAFFWMEEACKGGMHLFKRTLVSLKLIRIFSLFSFLNEIVVVFRKVFLFDP